MPKSSAESSLGTEDSPGADDLPTEFRRLRPRDLEALQRLRERGPLTIPQAYDCGHVDSESKGHGMNRLVAIGLVAFSGWDSDTDDGLWSVTAKGRQVGMPGSRQET